MPKTIYTIASGNTHGCGHITTVHLDLADLSTEVNTIISEDTFFMECIRDQWNESAKEFNQNMGGNMVEIPLKGDDEDVDFLEFATKFPNEFGWGWDNGSEKYLNITIHPWTGTRYDTLG